MKTDDLRRKMEIDVADGTEDLEFECYMTERAELADLDELYEMDELAEDDPARRRMIEKAVLDESCWLVADSKQVLAYGIFDYSFKNQGCVKLIHVHADYRRQGVGAEMLMTFESTCSTAKIYASVPQSNLAAQEMLKSVGYRVTKAPHRDYSSDPQILFVKNIWEAEAPMLSEMVQ